MRLMTVYFNTFIWIFAKKAGFRSAGLAELVYDMHITYTQHTVQYYTLDANKADNSLSGKSSCS